MCSNQWARYVQACGCGDDNCFWLFGLFNWKRSTATCGEYDIKEGYTCSDVDGTASTCGSLDDARYAANITLAVAVLLLVWKFLLLFLSFKGDRARILFIGQIISFLSDIVIGCAAFATVGKFKDWADNDLKVVYSTSTGTSTVEPEYGFGWNLFLAAGFFAWILAGFTFVTFWFCRSKNEDKNETPAASSA